LTSTLPALEKPNYNYASAFSYTAWSQGTVLTLVNVPWNNDYRDIVRFATKDALDAWIDGKQNLPIEKMSYGKFGQNVKVGMPLNAVAKYNYLRAENPLLPLAGDEAKNYYYFITGVNMLAADTTELTLQLDVWQTYGYDVSFGSCYIERGHIGIANTRQFENQGRDYLTVPEGLDIGSEYRIVHTAREQIMSPASNDGYSILVCTSVNLAHDPGTWDDPYLGTAPGSQFEGIPAGASFYLFDSADAFREFIDAYSDKPWITQGILSITIIPDISRYHPNTANLPNASPDPALTFHDVSTIPFPEPKTYPLATNWRELNTLNEVLPERYRHLKKFFTYPYMVIELTTWTGSPLIIRPEAWQDGNATIREQSVLVPPGQRIAFMPYRYNADSATEGDKNLLNDDGAEYLDFATVLSNFPTLPLINNMAIQFLAANRNGLAFQFSAADWSQQRALQGNQVGYNQATQGMNLANQLTGIAQNQASAQAGVQSTAMAQHAAVGALGSVVGGGLGGGPVGLAGGLASGAAGVGNALVSQNALRQSTENTMGAMGAANAARVGTQEYMRDTNRGLADWAARGDYQNAVAGINAKIQDARLTQPSVQGQFGGDAMNLVHQNAEVAARWKLVSAAAIRSVGDYWLRYGYAVHAFGTLPTTLMCMTKFTYWKLTETYISQGAFPEGFKQVLRGIFEKGVTVWADPDYIGRTDWADNEPIAGISY
jgi:hypothetical protein